jgi:tetratricopeptide (TPR) repeat protein
MTMTTTNVEILRQGWLDAASALAPGLETLPESLESGLDAAVVDERLDEQSLLRVVTEVTSTAADSLPADELYFLSRRLQRAVYEYLLSLDALPESPRRDGANGRATADATLIGAEEVAALGRNGAARTKPQPAHELETASEEHAPEPEAEFDAESVLETESEPDPASLLETESAQGSAGLDMEAGLAELDSELSPDYSATEEALGGQLDAVDAEDAAPMAPAPASDGGAVATREPSSRPAFTLFRRTGAKSTPAPLEANGHIDADAAVADAGASIPAANGQALEELAAFDSNASEQPHPEVEGEEEEPFVAPRDGFHLSDLADFAVVQRSAKAAPTPAGAANAQEPAPPAAPPQVEAAESANGAPATGWRLRDGEAAQGADAGAARSADDDRFDTDPEVVEARLEINDRLRRKRCDEAAALLQRLANDVGGRALAELALDAGDRCRSLGKGNAALSCYLAASRADPVHETPLLRLADICMDDHDIDLAVSYLERVTRLRRLRNDDKGALKLYRKIVTIAPYRDDILAMLMRAQASGRFEE